MQCTTQCHAVPPAIWTRQATDVLSLALYPRVLRSRGAGLDGMKNIFVKSLHSADAVNNADLIYACDYLFMYGFVGEDRTLRVCKCLGSQQQHTIPMRTVVPRVGLWTLATIVILLGSVFPIFYRPVRDPNLPYELNLRLA